MEPFVPGCPDAAEPLASGEVARLDGLGQLACFGRKELHLRGALYCGHVTEDGPASLGGTDWITGPVRCHLDESFPVYGSAVTEIDIDALYPDGFFDLFGHFDDHRPRHVDGRPATSGMSSPRKAARLKQRSSPAGYCSSFRALSASPDRRVTVPAPHSG